MQLRGDGYRLNFVTDGSCSIDPQALHEIDAGAMRTPSGSPTAEARKKHGIRSGPNKGKFPIWDRESAESARHLLLHAKPPLTQNEIEGRQRLIRQYTKNTKKQ